MKHLKLTLIIFSLIAISALHSCKPEPPDPQPTDLGFFGLGEAKDYVYFKKGTWWVYQNTRTGQLDTIVVYNSILDTSERISKKWKYIDEVFAVDSRSISTAHYYHLYERYGPVDVINRPRNLIIPNFERREPFLRDHPIAIEKDERVEKQLRDDYTVIATRLLPLLEVNPESWEAVSFLNLTPHQDNKPLVEHLDEWKSACPAQHRPFVASLEHLFLPSNPRKAAAAVTP